MFTNLIESSSHRRELKRRGSFFAFTVLSYGIFFALAGVFSVVAYDARVSAQQLELVTLLEPIEFPDVTPVPDRVLPAGEAPAGDQQREQNIATRTDAFAPVNSPIVPDGVSATPATVPPVPQGIYTIGDTNSDPGVRPGSGGSGRPENSSGSRPVVVMTEPPPAAPEPRQVPKVVSKRVLNGEAIELPKPAYPRLAQETRVQGTVLIQVLLDESGKVISAQVASGHPLLSGAAKQAAYRARFSPTMIGDQPVKVSGIITYNFVLN